MMPNSTSLILCNAVVARYTNVVDGFVTIASGDQRDADRESFVMSVRWLIVLL